MFIPDFNFLLEIKEIQKNEDNKNKENTQTSQPQIEIQGQGGNF